MRNLVRHEVVSDLFLTALGVFGVSLVAIAVGLALCRLQGGVTDDAKFLAGALNVLLALVGIQIVRMAARQVSL